MEYAERIEALLNIVESLDTSIVNELPCGPDVPENIYRSRRVRELERARSGLQTAAACLLRSMVAPKEEDVVQCLADAIKAAEASDGGDGDVAYWRRYCRADEIELAELLAKQEV